MIASYWTRPVWPSVTTRHPSRWPFVLMWYAAGVNWHIDRYFCQAYFAGVWLFSLAINHYSSNIISQHFFMAASRKLTILLLNPSQWHRVMFKASQHHRQLGCFSNSNSNSHSKTFYSRKYTDIHWTIVRLKPMRVYLPHYFMDCYYIANILTSAKRAG